MSSSFDFETNSLAFSDDDSIMKEFPSWIQSEERLEKITQNYPRENMDTMNIYFLYINDDLYIEKIIYEKLPLEILPENDNKPLIKKEVLLQMIQNKKTTSTTKYSLMDILVYNVDLEPQHIQSYCKNENIDESSKSFFKVLPILDDIPISPSIFIFHSINSIYVLFKFKEHIVQTHKSILKKSLLSDNGRKTTKKVKIVLKPGAKCCRITRKNM
jgi:hypothetical protein